MLLGASAEVARTGVCWGSPSWFGSIAGRHWPESQRDVFEKSAMRGTTLSPLRHGVPWLQAAMADADDTADYLHPG